MDGNVSNKEIASTSRWSVGYCEAVLLQGSISYVIQFGTNQVLHHGTRVHDTSNFTLTFNGLRKELSYARSQGFGWIKLESEWLRIEIGECAGNPKFLDFREVNGSSAMQVIEQVDICVHAVHVAATCSSTFGRQNAFDSMAR